MSEMIERVARAIEATYEQFSDPTPAQRARAAIEAMRVPTPDQGRAMYAAWDKFGEDAIMGPEEAIAIYQAAIDASLNADTRQTIENKG